jgi:hypothetical protein
MSAPVLFSGLSGGAGRIVIMKWVVLGATKVMITNCLAARSGVATDRP